MNKTAINTITSDQLRNKLTLHMRTFSQVNKINIGPMYKVLYKSYQKQYGMDLDKLSEIYKQSRMDFATEQNHIGKLYVLAQTLYPCKGASSVSE